MATASPGSHAATPNSEVSQDVSPGSLSGETTAPMAQAGEGPVIGGLPDSSNENKVVSK